MTAARVDLVTRDAGRDVRRIHARELAPEIIQQLDRLVRIGQLHALDNEATRRQIELTAEVLRDYHLRSGEGASLFFENGNVYFAGEPLRASRAIYELAHALERVVERCGGVELSFAPEVSAPDLSRFLSVVVALQRDPRLRFADHDVPNVRVRASAHAAPGSREVASDIDDDQRLVAAYSSAVVILRRFHESLSMGVHALPRRIKRVAQSLVDLSEGSRPSFLGVTSVRNANHDLAGQAVNTAILAVAMARQLTDDRVTLTRIAMAAMLQDVGLPRARGGGDPEDDAPILAAPSEAADRALPAGTAAVLTTLGRVNEPTIVRTVIGYEALWLRRASSLGPVHRGLRPATLQARIVATARLYNELLTPRPGEPALSPEEALVQLEEAATDRERPFGGAADRTALRLLMGALGVLPKGVLVELSSGEIAVVVEHRRGAAPLVRVLVDATAEISNDAGDFRIGSDARTIARIVGIDPAFAQRRDARGEPAREERRAPSQSERVRIEPTREEPRDDATVVTASPFDAALAAPAPEEVAPRPPLVPEALAADVEGLLARTPLPNLFVHLLARSLTGTLVLRPETGGEYAIVFENAIPLKTGGDFGGARLGDLLVASGELDASHVVTAIENARKSALPLGRQLVADGVLNVDRLAVALQRQMEDRVRALATIAQAGTYTFYRGRDLLVGPRRTQPTPLDPLAAVLVSARAWNDPLRIATTLRGIDERVLALHVAATPQRFRMDDAESAALSESLGRRRTIRDAIASSDALRPLVYALAVTRHLDVGGTDAWPLGVDRSQERELVRGPNDSSPGERSSFAPVSGPMRAMTALQPTPTGAPQRASTPPAPRASVTPPPPRASVTEPAPEASAPQESSRGNELRRTLQQYAKKLAHKNPYELLDIPRTATQTEVQAAYLRAVKVVHPDRIPAEYADLREACARIFSALTDASQLLSDPERRKAYDAGDPDPAQEVARVLGAATNFAKAEVMLKRNDVAAATEYARLAVEGDPERGEYVALLAWLESMALAGAPESNMATKLGLRDLAKKLDRALELSPDLDRAHYYRGSILKRLGREDEAIRDFRKAAQLNAENIDAVREVRLHQMRSAEKEKSAGLLSRWFGKKG